MDGQSVHVQRRINKRLNAQFGAISRDQALSAGSTRTEIETRLRKEIWQPALPGIYKVGGSPATPEQRLMAAVLWAGDGAVIAYRSAAYLWKLEGDFDDAVEIILPRPKRSPPGVKVHNRKISPSEKTYLGVLPVTTVTRTLFDLSSMIPINDLLVARDDALRRRLTTWRRLRAQLTKAERGQAGAKVFRKAMMGDNRGESPLERRFLAMARRFRLPEPELQYPITLKSGVTVFIDFAFPLHRLAIEVDGFAVHGQQLRWQQDMDRANQLTELDWRTLRFSNHDLVRRPERVAARILACLNRDEQRRQA